MNLRELERKANHKGEIAVEIVELPERIKGCVMLNKGKYTIVINKLIGQDEQTKAYRHELEHIAFDDFNKKMAVSEIENLRHIQECY